MTNTTNFTKLRGIIAVPWTAPVFDNTGKRVTETYSGSGLRGTLPISGPTMRYAVLDGTDCPTMYATLEEAQAALTELPQ